jgi:hypothetical protein
MDDNSVATMARCVLNGITSEKLTEERTGVNMNVPPNVKVRINGAKYSHQIESQNSHP